MTIIKVIVDELPKDCADCVFSEWRHRKQWWECDCFSDKNTTLQGERPDWCPLLQGWISVEDRLPEMKQEILVYGADAGIFIDEYNGDMFCWATHWMPLPEPPESEE